MTVFNEVINALNENEEAKKLMRDYESLAKLHKPSVKDYQMGRELVLMKCIAIVPEAMKLLSKYTYENLKGGRK